MTVERYFLDGFRDEVAYKDLEASPVFPLVREIEFKYGLKVVRPAQIRLGYHDTVTAWHMAYPNGIIVCSLFVDTRDSKVEYCYRSPYYSKMRGEDREDKQTLRSVKVSSLMASLSRQCVVPSSTYVAVKKLKQIQSAVGIVQSSCGKAVKPNDFTTDELHAVLLMALGRNPENEWVKVDTDKCQKTLDIWNQADKVRAKREEESTRLFTKPFFMVGVDGMGDYLVGKFKLSSISDLGVQHETIEQFKRYRNYTDVPELIPMMTMTKLAYEGKDLRMYGAIPVGDMYNPDLDAVFFYNSTPSTHEHLFMVTPCPT